MKCKELNPANTKHLYNIYTTSAQHCINVIQMFCVCCELDIYDELKLKKTFGPHGLNTNILALQWLTIQALTMH